MSKNFDETVRLQSEKREEWIREVRGERQGIAEGRSNVSVRPAYQPRCLPGEMSVWRLIVA